MQDSHAFLETLAIVLCVAAVTTVVFQRLRLPVIFGYLFAGMIVGPHIPVPIVADAATVRTLSELGVILLMFSLGLEFRLRRVLQVGATSGLAALAETSMMLGSGFLVGQLLGWTTLESLFAGAIVAISSTTVVAKAFADQGLRGRTTEIVFGILIVEDLIAIFLVAILTALASGGGLSAGSLGVTAVRLATFLAGLVGLGLLVIPRLVRVVVRLQRPETTLVASVGICFAAALLALSFGYSVALGAFIAGSLVAESGEAEAIEHLIVPVRDMFVALFFVSVGMLLDPRVIAEHWDAVLVLTLLVIVGKVVAVTAGSFLTGNGLRPAVHAGMSLAQIGEFSFIIAAIGLASGATRPFLYPVAIAVSAITALTTPWLIRVAGPVALYADRKLPHSLQTFVALYGSWIERMRGTPEPDSAHSRVRRLVRLLLLDAILLAAVVIGAAAEMGRFTTLLHEWTGLSVRAAGVVVVVGAVALGVPLLIGLFGTARLLGSALAARALPVAAAGKLDLAAAPRRALVTTLQIGILLLVGIPLLALTQPFLPRFRGIAILMAAALLLGFAFWRSARNLQGHAQAGAEVILMALSQQMARADTPENLTRTMHRVSTMLPGLGEPVPLRIPPDSAAVGRTLAELNLRGLTGATVLGITRGSADEARVIVPMGSDRLHAGDLLALAGSHEAVAAAEAILSLPGPATSPAPSPAEASEPTAPGEALPSHT